ncbi:DUF4383 domain-containing protein [Sinomonas halotolerans]|uniref:DUF4383 domain-containing protein n=1 Tax=Sinomonas halotolerans TaxID=1644133 RepID=A0ABU9X2P3_9MICC
MATTTAARTPAQTASAAVGIVFLLVAVLGFVPGITTGALDGAGHDSSALLLGIFQVSVLHNIVHLLFGVAGLAMARTHGGARSFLVWGGAVYLVLFLYGLFVAGPNPANFVPVNAADNILHLVLGIGMLALGLALGRRGHTARV